MINLLYYEHLTDKEKYFYVNILAVFTFRYLSEDTCNVNRIFVRQCFRTAFGDVNTITITAKSNE